MYTVMVAEDSYMQRQLIAKLLQSHEFNVLTVKDGVEALEQLQTTPLDLIVLDVEMPKLNGYEVCRRLKADPRLRKLPVIFCSSNNTQVGRYWGIKLGAAAYVSKPFQPQDFLETLNNVLRPAKQPTICR